MVYFILLNNLILVLFTGGPLKTRTCAEGLPSSLAIYMKMEYMENLSLNEQRVYAVVVV